MFRFHSRNYRTVYRIYEEPIGGRPRPRIVIIPRARVHFEFKIVICLGKQARPLFRYTVVCNRILFYNNFVLQ